MTMQHAPQQSDDSTQANSKHNGMRLGEKEVITKPDTQSVNDKSEFIIEVEHLTKKFGTFEAVKDISFKVKRGQIFAFLGPNGAGKSTTIKMLTTLLNPTSGKLTVGGYDVVTHQSDVRQQFGIVFQDPSLDDELTAYENMDFHGALYGVDRDKRYERIKYLLTFVELWDRQKDLVKSFSGGMKRRLEIARGLLHHPHILYLDEPTLGLDPQTRNNMWEHIKKLNEQEGMTVFFTTHYMEEAERIADTVAVIDHGKILTIGSPQKLMDETKTENLEDAFLKFTGTQLRAEENSGADNMRQRARMWGRK